MAEEDINGGLTKYRVKQLEDKTDKLAVDIGEVNQKVGSLGKSISGMNASIAILLDRSARAEDERKRRRELEGDESGFRIPVMGTEPLSAPSPPAKPNSKVIATIAAAFLILTEVLHQLVSFVLGLFKAGAP